MSSMPSCEFGPVSPQWNRLATPASVWAAIMCSLCGACEWGRPRAALVPQLYQGHLTLNFARPAHFPRAPTKPACVQVDVNKVWLTFSSIILAFSFMFGTSIANMYQAVVFLFVVRTSAAAAADLAARL